MNLSLDTKELLNNGADQLGLVLPSTVQEQIINFISLLQKWNKTYNLTAIHSTQEIIVKHILDSLSIAPFISGPNILDVGTGAGFPGIPLALILPKYQFTLLDSNNKKTTFLRHVVSNLSPTNVEIATTRVEKYHPASSTCFNTIVTRATSTILDIIEKSQHLCCHNGQFLLMKGRLPIDELNELQYRNEIYSKLQIKTHILQVPYLEAERHLICIQRSKSE